VTYYELLGLLPAATEREIRQAYRELSRQYHPDTTQLPIAIAQPKFQQLNEAYATLSNPLQRDLYDRTIGYSRIKVTIPLPHLSETQPQYSRHAYLDATDRPLSSGELFVLFVMAVTFVVCLVLAIGVGFSRTEVALEPEFAREFGFQPATAEIRTEPAIESAIAPHASGRESIKIEVNNP
jgi:hypothetical protein